MLSDKKQYYMKRDTDMKCGLATAELTAIYNAIDDARTETDNPKVLEVGCGSGAAMIRLMTEFGFVNIKGIDVDEVSVEYCKNRGLDVIQGDILALPFDDDSFDAIYGQNVLEHIENKVAAVKECLRVAKRVVFILGMGERPDAVDSTEHELPYLKQYGDVTEDVLKDLFKDVPYERHKVIKDVVVYEYRGHKIKNYAVVFDRVKKEKEEVE